MDSVRENLSPSPYESTEELGTVEGSEDGASGRLGGRGGEAGTAEPSDVEGPRGGRKACPEGARGLVGTASRRVRRDPLAGAERLGTGLETRETFRGRLYPTSEKATHPFRGQAVPPLWGKTQN